MEESCFELDPTLPWGILPYFIKQCIYWRAMVQARNEMGWRTLHEQLFPIEYKKQSCWDCGHDLLKNTTNDMGFFANMNDLAYKYCTCSRCGLTAQRVLYRVKRSHHPMYIRNLVRYNMHVFGYLIYNRLSGFRVINGEGPLFDSRLLTGYHINRENVLCRYFDEDNTYTRKHNIFRPIYLQYRSTVFV